ncbi:hypothetical protein LINGRAPRIM_LOCUS155, partial [Linum grandiflorum]
SISTRSRIAPVQGICRVHTRSASDHGVDGAVEAGNKHLPHVPRRVHSNSTGCCKSDGLTNDGRCAVCVGCSN